LRKCSLGRFVSQQHGSGGTYETVGTARALQGGRGLNAGKPAASFKMAFRSVKARPKWKAKDRYDTLKMSSEAFITSVKKNMHRSFPKIR